MSQPTDSAGEYLQQVTELKGRYAVIDRSQPVIEFHLDGMILTGNEKFPELTGYSLGDLVGQHHRVLAPGAELVGFVVPALHAIGGLGVGGVGAQGSERARTDVATRAAGQDRHRGAGAPAPNV